MYSLYLYVLHTFLFCLVHDVRNSEFSPRLNVNVNSRGCTALHYAALMDNENIIKLLLDAGRLRYVESK